MDDLAGKQAIVTGGARGTGAAIVRRLTQLGCHVLFGDVLDEAGEAVAKGCGELATYTRHDVTEVDAWQRVVNQALEARGRIDVLVNNAAVLHLGGIENTSEDVVRRVLEVNTLGAYFGIQAVAAPMRAQGGGSIVNVSSVDGMLGMNGVTAYCTSKWAMRGMSKSAAMELGRAGIRVNTVCPAGGNPEMYGPWFEQLGALSEGTKTYTNNRGIPGEAPLEVIADAVAFLASDASRHCTGVDLPVDGGAQAGRYIPGFSEL